MTSVIGDYVVSLKKSVGLKKWGFLKLDLKVEVDTVFALIIIGVLVLAALVVSGIGGAPKIGQNGLVGQAVKPVISGCIDYASAGGLVSISDVPSTIQYGLEPPILCRYTAASSLSGCSLSLMRNTSAVTFESSNLGLLSTNTIPIGCKVGGLCPTINDAVTNQIYTMGYKCTSLGTTYLACGVDEGKVDASNAVHVTCADTTVPTVHSASSAINGLTASFFCNATDNYRLQNVELWVKSPVSTTYQKMASDTTTSNYYAFNKTLTFGSTGSYQWYCKFIDALGNYKQSDGSFILASVPVVTILSPGSTVDRSSQILLDYTATNSPSLCQYSIDGGAYAVDSGCDGAYFNAVEGTHTITVKATNSKGTGQATKAFTVNVPLIVVGVSPKSLSSIPNNPVTFVYQVNTPNQINNCSIYLNDQRVVVDTTVEPNINQNVTWSVTETENSWYAKCQVGTKSAQSNSIPFYVLNLSATKDVSELFQVTSLSPSAGYSSTSSIILFKTNVASTKGLVKNCVLYVDGINKGMKTEFAQTQIQDVSFTINLTNGQHSWNVQCSDSMNPPNTAQSLNRTIYINTTIQKASHETTPPVVTLLSPANNAKDTDGAVQFSYVVKDNSSIENCSLLVENVRVATDEVVSRSLTQLLQYSFVEGNYSWSVTCTDEYGNRGVSSERVIVVDLPNVVEEPQLVEVDNYNNRVLTGTLQTWATIPSERVVRMTLNTKGPVYQILFETIDESTDARLLVLDLRQRPDGVPGIDKIVYGYMEITPQNMGELKSGNIFFRVLNSWLESKGITPEDVALYRFVGEDWVQLPTEVLSSESGYSRFQATTPGFSYFLVGQKGASETTATAPEVIDKDGTFAGTNTLPGEQAPTTVGGDEYDTSEPSKDSSGFGALILLVIILAVAIGGFMIWKSKGAKKPPLGPSNASKKAFKLPDFK
ncbi:MAG: PGF-pre-PGF domain-containing protein [Candidatus Woesearchaeota archaeon]